MAGGLKGLLDRIVGGKPENAAAKPSAPAASPAPAPSPPSGPLSPPLGPAAQPAPLTRLSDLDAFVPELSGDDFEEADGVTIVPDEDTDLGDALKSIREEADRQRKALRKGRLINDPE